MKKLILFCILTIALLLFAGCKKAEEEPAPPALPEPVIIVEEPTEEAEPGKMLSELRCIDGAIEAVVTNTGETEAAIGDDIKVMINGLLIVDPECDKYILAPGESTYCKDISGHIKIRTGKENRIQLNALRERALEVIDCGE